MEVRWARCLTGSSFDTRKSRRAQTSASPSFDKLRMRADSTARFHKRLAPWFETRSRSSLRAASIAPHHERWVCVVQRASARRDHASRHLLFVRSAASAAVRRPPSPFVPGLDPGTNGEVFSLPLAFALSLGCEFWWCLMTRAHSTRSEVIARLVLSALFAPGAHPHRSS